jgi:hypothetical protein
MDFLRPFRLATPLLAAGAIGVAMVVVDLLSTAVFGITPGWLPPRYYDYMPFFGGRVARVEQLEQAGQVDDAHLVVAIGSSTTQYGLDPVILRSHDPAARNWLILGCAGAQIRNMEFNSLAFDSSTLHPSMVALCIHEWMFHRFDRVEYGTPQPWLTAHSWLLNNHRFLSSYFLIQLHRGTDSMGQLFGLPLWESYSIEKNPWEGGNAPTEPHAPPDNMKAGWTALNFEMRPEQFQNSQIELDAFRDLIGKLRAHSQRVIIVLMPESSQLRAVYPSYVDPYFRKAVADLNPPPQVINLQNALPDEMLYDYDHVNTQGRARLSEIFPAAVQ